MWQIHSWDKGARSGTVRSPHFGPLPFGAAANPKGTDDFVVGEEVVVSLAGDPSDYRVESVREVRPSPQPEGTHCADFDAVSGANFYVFREGDPLVIWFGDCCCSCDPGALVTFTGVRYFDVDDEDDWTNLLLRFASKDEIRRYDLPVNNAVAYCLADRPSRPWDGCQPRFIVAKSVSVENRRPRRGAC